MTLFQHVSAWFSEVGEISDPMDQLTSEADFGKQKILRLLASRWPLVLAGWRWDLNQRIKKSNTTQSDNNMATMATQFIFYCSFVCFLNRAHFEIDQVRMVWISCIVFWDRWQNCKLSSLNWRYYGLLWHTLEICAPRAIDCQSYIREHTHSSWTTMDSLWFRPFLLRSDERSEAGSGCCILWKCDLKLGPSKENCAHGKINGFASGCYVKI